MKFNIFPRRKAGLSYWQRLRGTRSGCDEPPPPATACQADETTLDCEGHLIRRAQAVLDETPEVREERVDELRQQVQSGTYKIPFAQLMQTLTSLILRKH